jgi:hypothetical protein
MDTVMFFISRPHRLTVSVRSTLKPLPGGGKAGFQPLEFQIQFHLAGDLPFLRGGSPQAGDFRIQPGALLQGFVADR